MIMNKKFLLIVAVLLPAALILSACNLPRNEMNSTPTFDKQTFQGNETPTPVPSLCDNLYFPNTFGDSWEYAGSTSATGDYSRTDTVTHSNADSFSVESNTSGMPYTVDYTCTAEGLVATNPIQQYLGAILASLNTQVSIHLISNSGISYPANINPGDSWQQTAEWEASAQGFSMNGRFVFDYTATGYETVTVSSGTFDALRVNSTIRIEVSDFRIQYGTYEMTTWMAPNVGIIKSEGRSNVPNVEFSDMLELVRYTVSP
jgi:hypothetical protein